MKHLILSLGVALLVLAPPAAMAEVTDRIVAIVNDEVVTLREVERFVTVEKKSKYSSVNEYTRNLMLREKLDSFIDGLLISQQAKKLKIEIGDKEVEAAIDNIRKQNLVSDAELRQQLKNDNIDYNEFAEGIKRSMIRNRVLARVVMQEVNLDERALKAYYNAHRGEYVQDEYKLQHLFISSQRKNADQRAQAAIRALERNKPFGEVCMEYSDESSTVRESEIVFTRKDDLIPELRDAVGLLIPGTYTHVVRTGFGYHILKLVEVRKSPSPSYESVKEEIKARLFQVESEARYKSFVAKLRSSSYVEVKI
jgi:peptidyl-prolyl cis-trans isomerase SurA